MNHATIHKRDNRSFYHTILNLPASQIIHSIKPSLCIRNIVRFHQQRKTRNHRSGRLNGRKGNSMENNLKERREICHFGITGQDRKDFGLRSSENVYHPNRKKRHKKAY